MELIKNLQADGLPYVSFKPGTVDQIRQVVRIAKAVAPAKVLIEVEGGSAGGHHSWESLDDLLLSTYAEVREQANLVLVVGGGIGTPERGATTSPANGPPNTAVRSCLWTACLSAPPP